VGGASKFVAEIKKTQKLENPLTFFSGDIFSPSLSKLK
jgi:hypothetical protein